jgi:hypothetical protein
MKSLREKYGLTTPEAVIDVMKKEAEPLIDEFMATKKITTELSTEEKVKILLATLTVSFSTETMQGFAAGSAFALSTCPNTDDVKTFEDGLKNIVGRMSTEKFILKIMGILITRD